MHYLKYNFSLLLLAIAFVAGAQSEESSAFRAEQLLIQTDRQLYISGEIIWFKVFAFDEETLGLSNFSKIAYLELISPERIAISRVKIKLGDGRGNGTIELPRALNSGNYTLRAYTQAMRNGEEEDFARAKLIILNPDQSVVRADTDAPDTYAGFAPQHPVLPMAPNRMMNIQLATSQSVVGQRSETVVEVTTTDENGRPVAADISLAIALKAADRQATRSLFAETTDLAPADRWRPAAMSYPVEDQKMRLSGRVIDEGTQAGAPNAKVFLAFPGEVALVYLEETDKEGNFSFLLPELYGLRQVVLQTHPEETRALRMELTDEFHALPTVDKQVFMLPPNWIAQANAALVNAQIQQSYQAFELPPVFETSNPFDSIPFFGRVNARYQLDDYTRFPIPEFFFEIVYEVVVRGKFGSERLEVVNEWKSPFDNPDPLFLVDGVPVFDQRVFLRINNKLIETAEVVTDPFWMNPEFYNGIIQLKSFEKDGRCFRLPESALQRSFLTLLPERQFSMPDYVDQPDSRLPDFRNTLYWNPSVRTDANGRATVRFHTGDSVGNFEIRAEGISDDGYVGSALGSMEVVKEVK